MTNIFFASDHHFYHKNIQKFCPMTRFGEDVEQMNELMIEAHNKKVKPGSLVYFLGDFSFGTAEQTNKVLSRLNGDKHLIYGNHDKVIKGDRSIQNMFVTVQDYKKIHIDKISVVLFHFPIMEWDQAHRGAYHLFGHVHGEMVSKPHGRSMDEGIDARPVPDMAPWSWDEIHQELKNRPIIQHHGD
jgi:calcineurin-like phosphoesterase family protein